VPADQRAMFDELVAEARYGLQRDDNVGVNLNWPAGRVRRAVLEAGRRLCDKALLASLEHAIELCHPTGSVRSSLRARARPQPKGPHAPLVATTSRPPVCPTCLAYPKPLTGGSPSFGDARSLQRATNQRRPARQLLDWSHGSRPLPGVRRWPVSDGDWHSWDQNRSTAAHEVSRFAAAGGPLAGTRGALHA
jgi:hypothetical protein